MDSCRYENLQETLSKIAKYKFGMELSLDKSIIVTKNEELVLFYKLGSKKILTKELGRLIIQLLMNDLKGNVYFNVKSSSYI